MSEPSTSARLRETQRELAAAQAAFAASQADLTAMERQRDRATRLLSYALHLRMHGERAPGGNETWAQFDQDVEYFLRDLPARPTPHLDAVKRERDEALADANSARHLLGRIEKAAGAEDTDPFTDLAEFVRGLRVERDEARAQLDKPCGSCHPCNAFGAQQDRDLAQAELVSARTEIEQLTTKLRIFRNSESAGMTAMRNARDKARAEAEQLRAQLAPVHAWAVADGDLAWRCGACSHLIRRGEAFRPTGPGRHAHIYCPTPTQET